MKSAAFNTRTKLSVEHRIVKSPNPSSKQLGTYKKIEKKENLPRKTNNAPKPSSVTNNYFSFGINAQSAPPKRDLSRNDKGGAFERTSPLRPQEECFNETSQTKFQNL